METDTAHLPTITGIRTERAVGEPLPPWSLARLVLFRFVYSYLALFVLWRGGPVEAWVGQHLFGVDASRPAFTGSGDTTFEYVRAFCVLVGAAAVTVVWSLLDRKRADYRGLLFWVRLPLRFVLAQAMIGYGAAKIIDSQFPPPLPSRLAEPVGDMSPMGLLWTFMGASEAYTAFAGLAEMIGGILLTTRRTTLLGALVSAGVLANVVMLNLCYDVPVKLYSLHLLAMALVLIAPDARRLANLFLQGRGVGPVDLGPVSRQLWARQALLALRTTFVLLLVLLGLFSSYQNRQIYRRASETPLFGVWKVEEFSLSGNEHVPPDTDASRWRRLICDYPGGFSVERRDGNQEYYQVTVDDEQMALTLAKYGNPKWKGELSYREPEVGIVTLDGTFGDQKLQVRLSR